MAEITLHQGSIPLPTQDVQPVTAQEGAINAKDFARDLKTFNAAVLKDQRWETARKYFEDQGKLSEESAINVLREGAKAFGLWPLSESALAGLVRQFLHEPNGTSEAFEAWMKAEKAAEELNRNNSKHRVGASTNSEQVRSRALSNRSVFNDAYLAKHRKPKDSYLGFADDGHLTALRIGIVVVIFIMSILYALDVVLNKYKGVIDVFGWPVFVARAGGLGALLWTALVYLTMSRTFMRSLLRYASCGWRLSWLLDAHKEIHIFCGYGVVITGLVHAAAHAVGTAPGIVRSTTDADQRKKINDLIGCNNADTTPNYLGVRMKWLEWPDCPVNSEMNYLDVLFRSTIGLTGILLVVVILITYKTAQHRSDGPGRFETFWYVHNITIISWPLLLFLHGSNGWLGIGFPLVVLVCGLPVLLFSIDRVLRSLRYFCFAGKQVQIVAGTLRPGKDGGQDGALTMLNISKPPYLWSFSSGMYAFICMPDYAPLQWHPFTICSGDYDETVNFLIAGVGDWTRALAARCMAARDSVQEMPKIAIDGPYAAPTQSALSRELIIAVGAGVGVTPLLSLLSTLVVSLEEHSEKDNFCLKEAHFFWMTRSADEFLFGQDLITKIYTHAELRQKIHLHLHVTAKEPPKDASAYIFRECVRRQSAVDRELYFSTFKDQMRPPALSEGAPLPWCWVHGARQDVMWVSKLVHEKDTDEHLHDLLDTHLAPWAHGAFRKQSTVSATVDEDGQVCRHPKHGDDGQVGTKSTLHLLSDKVRGKKHHDPKLMVPVVFDRPDFAAEIHSIAKAYRDSDAHVYVCGNDAIVKHLSEVCDACNSDAKTAKRAQSVNLHFERFG